VLAFNVLTAEILTEGASNGTLTLTVDGVVRCTTKANAPCTMNIDAGKTVTLTIAPDIGSEVSEWRGPEAPGCSGTGTSVELFELRSQQKCAVRLRPAGTGPKPTNDAGTEDSGTPGPAASLAGFVKVLTTASGTSGEGKIGMSEADAVAESAPDEYALAALGLAPGNCSAGPWSPPSQPTPDPAGGDVGESIEVKVGTTTVAKLDRKNGNLYIGNGTVPAFGKTLDLSIPGSATRNVSPNLVPGLCKRSLHR
jgi:hypothetical protein